MDAARRASDDDRGVAAVLTLLGALLLSGGVVGLGSGDVTAVLSAACYALWMVELGRHMQANARPFTCACVQFLAAAVLTLPFGPGMETGRRPPPSPPSPNSSCSAFSRRRSPSECRPPLSGLRPPAMPR